MQFQVPQFIDTEDKIVGPLTIKQFFYLAGAGLISFVFFLSLQFWLFIAFSTPFLAAGIALAFFKVNGQPMPTVIGNFFKYYWAPQRYVWQPTEPQLPKNEENLRKQIGGGFSLENIVRGMALKQAWRYIQTGSKAKEEPPKPGIKPKEKYQIFRSISGDRRAAKRVDYR